MMDPLILSRIVKQEKMTRALLSMNFLDYVENLKALMRYPFQNKDYEISRIIEAGYPPLLSSHAELEAILTNINQNGENLFIYSNRVLDEKKSQYAMKSKDRLMQKTELVNMPDYSGKTELLRAKKMMPAEYAKHNLICDDKRYNKEQRTQEMKNSESITDFVDVMCMSSSMLLKFSKVLVDQIENTKFIYEIIPNHMMKEYNLKKSQNELLDAVISYKEILTDSWKQLGYSAISIH